MASSTAVWSTWPQAVVLILTGATMRPALPVAVVVGPLLCLLNQGTILLSGQVDVATVGRMAGKQLRDPYLVSSLGFLSAHRTRTPDRPPRRRHRREDPTPGWSQHS